MIAASMDKKKLLRKLIISSLNKKFRKLHLDIKIFISILEILPTKTRCLLSIKTTILQSTQKNKQILSFFL